VCRTQGKKPFLTSAAVVQGPVAKPGKTDAELKEEEELQLVLALSKEQRAQTKYQNKLPATYEPLLADLKPNHRT
jgi:hypothetical protein